MSISRFKVGGYKLRRHFKNHSFNPKVHDNDECLRVNRKKSLKKESIKFQPAVHADRFERAIEREGIQDRPPIVHLDAIGGEVQTVRQGHTYHRQRSQSLLLAQLHVAAGKVPAGRDHHFLRRSRCGRIDLPSVSRRNFTLERRNGAGGCTSRITNSLVRCHR